MKQVSVIIPTYNRTHTILRAIDSVFAQRIPLTPPSPQGEGKGIEIIIVDDGSTDDTKEKIRDGSIFPATRASLEKNRTVPVFRYLYQPNRGPAAARNLGILQTFAKFIAFLDSDDEWLPGKLAAQLKFFEENPDYLICQTEEIWIRNGRRVNPMKKHKKYGGWIFEKCLPLCIVSPSAVMVRREFFDKVGLFDESLPACEDYELWLRASAQLPIGLIEKLFLKKYGGHADQRSRQFPVMDRFRIQALQKLLSSGILNPAQKQAALLELARKRQIVSRGAQKRGNIAITGSLAL